MNGLILHDSLPFNDFIFYGFIAVCIICSFVFKFLFRKLAVKLYSYWLFAISIVYCLFLYPNPDRIITFVIYGYLIYRFLTLKTKLNSLLITIIYILPMFMMKLFNVLPEFRSDVRTFVQIAGISYMSFKMLQIHFDERNNAPISFFNYFAFLAFPPTLLIGPIDRYKRFNEDLNAGFSNVNQEHLVQGMNFFILGVLYKYILATLLNQLVLNHLPETNGLLYHILYMYTYLFFLFFDFAGYSLLAMGFGYMLGIKVPHNFDKPFLALNPKEFWQKWHKTLGDWLNDYFFKPIFKDLTTKKRFTPIQRQSIALLLTFTLMGFWNGFELHFIVSGILFGVYSAIHNYYQIQCKKQGRDVFFGNMKPKYVQYVSIVIMFNIVAFSIYIFSGKLF